MNLNFHLDSGGGPPGPIMKMARLIVGITLACILGIMILTIGGIVVLIIMHFMLHAQQVGSSSTDINGLLRWLVAIAILIPVVRYVWKQEIAARRKP